MRLVGYCVVCRRIRHVKISGPYRASGTPVGLCADCEREDERRHGRA